MISIIDYGVVNLGSIRNMLKKLGIEARLAATPGEVEVAEKILLPGVGAFDQGMAALREQKLADPVRAKALDGQTPVLGICLGMQLLARSSEEGEAQGLGIIAGECRKIRLKPDSAEKVPHMGWNIPEIRRPSPLTKGFDPNARFYFTHSYHLVCDDPSDVLATASHGIDFTAMVEHGNVMGAQFHPEKSHRFGMKLLRNFGEL